MNKKVYIAVIMMMFILSSCDTKSKIQKITNTTSEQRKAIEMILEEVDVNYSSDTIVSISNNEIIDGMDSNWEAYDLVNKDNSKYLLILRSSDKDVTALLDSENELIYGLIDNQLLPKYFESVITN